jgi:3-isopropylmalate/(R)-2-methylmalate dehydratase large subunit
MEQRMTICNMSIEMGARGGLIAPDETTFKYLKGRKYAPQGSEFEKAVKYWKTLKSEPNAVFDKEYFFDAKDIDIMLTYGTNPGMGISIQDKIPDKKGIEKALKYMNFQPNEKLEGKKIDYVFIGSCTNGRIEDLRTAAKIIKGHKKAKDVEVWIVPGSQQVKKQAEEEGLTKIFADAGIEIREPGCSACLAMNNDKIPAGKYCISTSNRNFEGRQGPGARTILASPLMAATAAITGKITDPKKLNI